jgi:tetratricopeptide (TPR) repeat protein
MSANRPTVKVSFDVADAPDYVEPVTQMSELGRLTLWGGALALIALVLYLPTVWAQFIYLDNLNIVENAALRSWRQGLAAIWSHPTMLPHFQPLAHTVLSVEYKMFGSVRAGGYLMFSVFFHAINVVLIWTLLRKLDVRGATVAAILFAVHPINVEAVAWASQQPLVLSTMFYLSALIVYARFIGLNPSPDFEGYLRLPNSQAVLYLLSIGLLVAGALCHPMAVSWPWVMVALVWWERGRITHRDIQPLLLPMFISIGWVIATLYVESARAQQVDEAISLGLLDRFLVGSRMIWIALMHMLAPVRLGFAYPKWTPNPAIDGALAGAVVMVLAACWLLRTRLGRSAMTAAVVCLLTMAPAMIFRHDLAEHSYLADHLLYLPGLTLMIAIAGAACDRAGRALMKPQWLAPAIVSAVAVALGALAVWHLDDYRDSTRLWTAALRADPGLPVAHNNLGIIALAEGRDAEAGTHFQAALSRDPKNLRAYINLANMSLDAGDTRQAVMRFQDAIQISPNDPDAHFGMALAMTKQGQFAAAIAAYNRVLEKRPENVLVHNNLGLIYSERGEPDRAIVSYHNAIRINPSFTPPYINLANLYFRLGRLEDARDMLEEAVRIDQSNFAAYMNAGAMVAQLSQTAARDEQERSILLGQSEQFFREAVRRRPDSPEARQQLGGILMLQKKFDDAIYEFGKVLEREPENAEAAQNLERARRLAESDKTSR